MTDFRERYKRVGYGREDADVNRALRTQKLEEARRELRSEHYSVHRNFGDCSTSNEDHFFSSDDSKRENDEMDDTATRKAHEEHEAAIQRRLQQLEKWREERNRKKLQDKKKAKPVFKVGVVHHRVYSPPMNKEQAPVPPPKLCRSKLAQHPEPPPKRVTRATEKRLAIKAVTGQQKREDLRTKKKEKNEQISNKDKVKQVELAPKDHQFKAPVGITPLPMFGRQALEASRKNLQMEVTTSINEFSKSVLTNVASVTDHSIIISKSTRSSNLSNSNAKPVDSSRISKGLNESLNNTSIESVHLKMSSDDLEMLDDQENINANISKHKRRSSRLFTPVVEADSTTELQDVAEYVEMEVDLQKTSSAEKSNTKSLTKNRSSKIQSNENSSPEKSLRNVSYTLDNQENISSTEEPVKFKSSIAKKRTTRANAKESAKDDSFVLQDQKKVDNQKNIDSNVFKSPPKRSTRRFVPDSTLDSVKDQEMDYEDNVQANKTKSPEMKFKSPKKVADITSMETSSTVQDLESLNKTKSPEKRFKSPKKVADKISEESPMETSPIVKDALSTIKSPRVRLTRHVMQNKERTTETSLEKNNEKGTKSPANKRRSTRLITFSEVHLNPPTRFSSIADGQEKIHNLLDSTLSDPIETKASDRRKSIKLNDEIKKSTPNLIDESLVKFSPRRSIRNQTNDVPEQTLIRFSPVDGKKNASMNESTSSEPTKRKIPDDCKNDSQNISLNVSLPKDSSIDRPPAFFSPYVVASRGKNSVRKEIRRRLSQPFVSENDIPTKDTIMQKLNISVEEEERTAQYYKHVLDQEISRLTERCDKWNVIKEESSTPEDVKYTIQAAVGHTQLLMNKKFQRFRSLVLDCETGKGEMLVTCKDLQGFWEMMYMEIKDCDNRFNKLEDMKVNDWVDQEAEANKEIQQPAKKKKLAIKKPAAKKSAPAKSSSLRALIIAARKKKLESQESSEVDVEMAEVPATQQDNKSRETTNNSTPQKYVCRSSTSTPKSSLLKKVQLSQTRKSTTSPLIVMKLSQMCKTPDVQLDDSIIYINSDRTPAKSILKSNAASMAKSVNKVIFKDSPMEYREFHDDDSKHEDDEDLISKEPIERRLNFEGESFSENEDKANNEPIMNSVNSIISLSPFSNSNNSGSIKATDVPKIALSKASPLISMSPLSLKDQKTDPQSTLEKIKGAKSKKISFKFNDTDEDDSLPSTKSSSKKRSAPSTPRPKRKVTVEENDNEDSSMEVDGSLQEEKDSEESVPVNGIRELYLNSDGIICERIVPTKVDTPRMAKLKRSNSASGKNVLVKTTITEKRLPGTPRFRKNNIDVSEKAEDSPGTPTSTPRMRRRNTQVHEVKVDTPIPIGTPKTRKRNTDVIKFTTDSPNTSGTPRPKRGNIQIPNIKISGATPDSRLNDSTESITPKVKRQSSKRSLADTTLTDKTVNEIDDEATPVKLRKKTPKANRTVSELKVAEEKPATPKLRRAKSLTVSKSASKESSEASTPSSARRNTKKPRKTTELKEHETDEGAKAIVKLSRSISLKKNMKLGEESTPENRRKSLRITRTTSGD